MPLFLASVRPFRVESTDTEPTMSLLELPQGHSGKIVGLDGEDHEIHQAVCRRLAELGFLKGERVRIIARGFAGREPIAVRIGTATFALRRFEAERVRVQAFSV